MGVDAEMVVRIDALRPGEMGHTYTVATYHSPDDPVSIRGVRAYTRWFNPAWSGCRMYEVIAGSGARAKAAAIKHRLAGLRSTSAAALAEPDE